MHMPTLREANDILHEAEIMNPGPWVNHSQNVALAAKLIAEQCKELDSEVAYIMGLLHDIGRREGVTSMRHAIDGYNFLHSKGFEDCARICMTHSFAVKDVQAVFGEWDCSEEELAFATSFLARLVLNDYDRLIMLCDALALPSGVVLLEKRLVDVALRYGTDKHVAGKWRATFAIKEDFENRIGYSIYNLFPDVTKNTFGF